MVTGQAPVTLELRNTLGKKAEEYPREKHKQPKVVHAYLSSPFLYLLFFSLFLFPNGLTPVVRMRSDRYYV